MKAFKVWIVAAALLSTAACHGAASPGLPPVGGLPPAAGALPEALVPVDSPAAVSPIRLSHQRIVFTATGASRSKTVTATERGFNRRFAVRSTCGAAVTISPRRARGPKARFKIVANFFVRSCSFAVSDGRHKAVLSVEVALPAPLASPSRLALVGLGAHNARLLSVGEPGYAGLFTVSDTCGAAASISPARARGPSAAFAITPLAAVSHCTVTVSDASHRSTTANVGIALPSPIVVSPNALSFDAVGATYAAAFTVGEAAYAGTFAASSTCDGIVSLSATTLAPDPSSGLATETATPVAAGTCTITLTDAYNQTTPVSVVVTTTGIGIEDQHIKRQ